MIKIEDVDISGFEAAIRGMRNPMNSWEKSDSEWKDVPVMGELFCIGENDLELVQSLVKAGTDHSKFMRMINVTLDIIAPLYWWKEFDTYKVGTVRNSCSTMHKIAEKEFILDDFSHEHILDCYTDDNGVSTEYETWYADDLMCFTVEMLNYYREKYLQTKDKEYWWQIIQLLPSSYNQRATVQLNYAVLRNMYHSRKNHKLDEWVEFCEWIETLPYSELITYTEPKVNTCVCCGEIVPEGRQVCPKCEKGGLSND